MEQPRLAPFTETSFVGPHCAGAPVPKALFQAASSSLKGLRIVASEFKWDTYGDTGCLVAKLSSSCYRPSLPGLQMREADASDTGFSILVFLLISISVHTLDIARAQLSHDI